MTGIIIGMKDGNTAGIVSTFSQGAPLPAYIRAAVWKRITDDEDLQSKAKGMPVQVWAIAIEWANGAQTQYGFAVPIRVILSATADTLAEVRDRGILHACKLYEAGQIQPAPQGG